MKRPRSSSLASLCLFLLVLSFLTTAVYGQQPQARVRIVAPVNDAQVVTLRGNTHPLARPQYDRGPAPDDLPARRMLLVLSRTAEQQSALDKFLQDQQSPSSPNYRRWLTPAEFGSMFGPVDSDVQAVTGWLQREGFSVSRVSAGKTVIEFSGSAGQIRHAFHTQLHKYVIDGEQHWANAQDPQVPAALAPVVSGLVSLNNFHPKPQLRRNDGVFVRQADGRVKPALTVTSGSSGTTYYALGPADFATIYGTNPLLQAGKNGTGETIAVLGVSNVHLQDISDFRNFFGLPANNPSVVIDGPDPGVVAGDETESVLDLEWAGAVAPGANVLLVSAEETETTSGLFLAALHVIENNLADVMSMSYSECEAQLGVAGSQFVQSLWEQAAAQGITVAVSSGDNGSAGCDSQDVDFTASHGLGVNGFASTAYNVAVGGTDFDDVGMQSNYWNTQNQSPGLLSAKAYIPEVAWNQSCAATATSGNLSVCPALPSSGTPPSGLNLFAGSGGVSSLVPKPNWQTGTGVPNDGFRDLPDVSLYAAAGSNSNSFYVLCEADVLPAGTPSCQLVNGGAHFVGVGGTSASVQAFAGIVALAAQNAGTRLGNLNYFLYSIAAGNGASCTSSASSGACVFNDVVKGNISVPCNLGTANCSSGSGSGVMITGTNEPAYSAAAGYDLATGLGSVNATNLANAIKSALPAASTTTTLTLNSSNTGPITATHGNAINIGVSVTSTGSTAPTGDVSLIGVNAAGANFEGIDFNSNPLSNGAVNWSSSLFPGGTYSVKAHYAGDGAHQSSDSNPPISVTIEPESSSTFVNLVSFDPSTGVPNFAATSAPYGSPYVLRVDVADLKTATFSSNTGVSSTCSKDLASCPTGTVTVTANGSALDKGSFPLNSKGFTEDQPIQLPAGSYTIAANYPGDASYNGSSKTTNITITKAQTSTSVTSPAAAFQYGTPAQINALVATLSSGLGPTGGVAFTDNGSAINPPPPLTNYNSQAGGANGYASLMVQASYVPPSVGIHNLNSQFAGDQNYLASSTSSPLSVAVGKADVSLTAANFPAALAPNESFTLSATMLSNSQLSPPTGTVTFIDNGAPISGTPTVTPTGGNGGPKAGFMAQMPVTFTQAGTHALSISYAGDANYNSTTQNIGTVNVTTTPLGIALPSGASQTMMPPSGGTGTASISILNATTATVGVSLSCKSDSTAATCSVNPPAVNVPANGTNFATVIYAVPALTGRLHPAVPFGMPFVFAGVLASFTCINRRKRALTFLVLATALAISMTSCGGGSHSSTPAVTQSNPSPKVYNFTVTATSGSNSDSKTITVTVQ